MKLRNKKTGVIIIPTDYTFATYDDGIRYGHHVYNSLAELNEDWEDADEPLIKDGKIRKAVRAWAKSLDLNPKDGIIYVADKSGLEEPSGAVIYFEKTILDPSKIEDGRHYSIEELCGSEEIEILEPTYTTIEEKEKLKEEE